MSIIHTAFLRNVFKLYYIPIQLESKKKTHSRIRKHLVCYQKEKKKVIYTRYNCAFSLSGSPRAISTNFPSASGSLFLSGWNFLLSLLYAALISLSEADLWTVWQTWVIGLLSSGKGIRDALSKILYRSAAETKVARKRARTTNKCRQNMVFRN